MPGECGQGQGSRGEGGRAGLQINTDPGKAAPVGVKNKDAIWSPYL